MALGKMLSVNQVAALFGWRAARIYRLCKAGRMPHLVLGGRICFEEDGLHRWLNEQRRETPEEQRERTREEECARLGIEANHSFS